MGFNNITFILIISLFLCFSCSNARSVGKHAIPPTAPIADDSMDAFLYGGSFLLICFIVLMLPFGLWCWKWIQHHFLPWWRRREWREVLDSLPIVIYGDHAAFSSECPICLDEFAAGEEICALPLCGHAYHAVCIKKWLGSHSECPFCRRVVLPALSTTM